MGRTEQLLSDLVEKEKLFPEHSPYIVRALEASHISLRLERTRPDIGCVPTSIAFTHGSSAITSEHLPLTTTIVETVRKIAKNIAEKNHQDFSHRLIGNLANLNSLDLFKDLDAAWVITYQSSEAGHVFGIVRVKEIDNLFAVYDTAAYDFTLLENSEFSLCSPDSLLRRIKYHHTATRYSSEIIVFKNKS